MIAGKEGVQNLGENSVLLWLQYLPRPRNPEYVHDDTFGRKIKLGQYILSGYSPIAALLLVNTTHPTHDLVSIVPTTMLCRTHNPCCFKRGIYHDKAHDLQSLHGTIYQYRY